MTLRDFPEIESLRIKGEVQTPPKAGSVAGVAPCPKSASRKGEFLKGPIPLWWLAAAAKLSGKAPLATALAIMFQVGRRKSQRIKLTSGVVRRFGLDRKAKYRGLKSLESGGLIHVKRRARKNPIVTVLVVKE